VNTAFLDIRNVRTVGNISNVGITNDLFFECFVLFF
jgi:hypothetical protein